MAKSIIQALVDEVHYPVGEGHAENKLLARGLVASDHCTAEVIRSDAFRGAVADVLVMLVTAPNFSEADKSFSLSDKSLIIKRANAIYGEIGEPENAVEGEPMVYVGDCLM